MIKFGPSGFCEDFATAGHKKSEEMPEWLASHGLSAYEISFTNGIKMSDEKCLLLGKLFAEKNITLSVHAPYYINFANPDSAMIEKSIGYIINSLKKMKLLGAKRLVFHPGALMKQSREEAHQRVLQNLKLLIERINQEKFDFEFQICPETMGKHGQCGTVKEVAEMCALDNRIIPTLDFGHINAFGQGSLIAESDFRHVFEVLKSYMGQRYKDVHIHFTHIEYGTKGEIKHVLASDNPFNFGPDFEPLAKVLKELDISGEIISESPGHQTREALAMKNIYNSTK